MHSLTVSTHPSRPFLPPDNYESTFYGAFSANHALQAASYLGPVLAWQAPARALAAAFAVKWNLSGVCSPEALLFACHLAPGGFSSWDQSVYMLWNGHFAVLPAISRVEYTLDADFARDSLYPLLDGLNRLWACALNKSATGLPPPHDYAYHDTRGDEEHEKSLNPDPQIALALARRTISAQLAIATRLGIAPPADLVDILGHLADFNTDAGCLTVNKWPCGHYNWTSPNGTSYSLSVWTAYGGAPIHSKYHRRRLARINRDPHDAPTPPHTHTHTHTHPPPPPPPSPYNTRLSDSDSFSLYPLWPAEAFGDGDGPLNDATAALAQASARAYAKLVGGRPVDVFASAVLAGQGFAFDASQRPGGSVVRAGGAARTAPAYAFAPLETLEGLLGQMASPCPPCCPCGPGGRLFGANALLYTDGGGVENVGVARAVDEMLVTAVGGPGGAVQIFPFWPQTLPASFRGLLVKGGLAVSAEYNNATRSVVSPMTIRAQYTWMGAPATTARLVDPWGVGPSGGVTATCAGASVPVAWDAAGAVLSFAAPIGIDCAVSVATGGGGASGAS